MIETRILSGKDLSQKIRDKLKLQIDELKTSNKNFILKLAIVQVGNKINSNDENYYYDYFLVIIKIKKKFLYNLFVLLLILSFFFD